MKLTESKLKELIIEVIAEEAEAEEQNQEIQDLQSIITVGDFFRELENFEAVYKAAKTARGSFDFMLGLLFPFYGNVTHFDDAAGALADSFEAANAPDGASLYEYEGDFPLLAFLDLDRFIEENVHPKLVSSWIKQLRQQLGSLNLSNSSPMPNADELFLSWLGTKEDLQHLAAGIRKALESGKINQAEEEYERKRAEWNKNQKIELMKKTADATDKVSGWKRLLKQLAIKKEPEALSKYKADAQRFSSQSPQFFESKK